MSRLKERAVQRVHYLINWARVRLLTVACIKQTDDFAARANYGGAGIAVVAEHGTVHPLDHNGPAEPAWPISIRNRPDRICNADDHTVSQSGGPADFEYLISKLGTGSSRRLGQLTSWVIALTKLCARSDFSNAGIDEIENGRPGNHGGAGRAGVYFHEVFQSCDLQV